MKKLLLLLIGFSSIFSIQAFADSMNSDASDVTTSQVIVNHDSVKSSESSGLGMIGLATPLFVYLFFSYCLYLLASKLQEEKAWLAFIPFFSIFLVLRMAKMSGWWILGLIVPLLNIYVVIRMMHQGISVRTGHGAGWTVGLLFLGAIFMPITAFTYIPTVTTIPTQTV